MYLSLFLGPLSRGAAEDIPVIDFCLAQAAAAAQAGYSMVTFGEQHFNGYEPYCNPLLMGARLSSVLGKTYFGTTANPLPFHHPLRFAEDVNILDVLLQGRLIIGASAGRGENAFISSSDQRNFGMDPARRSAAFASKMQSLLSIWAHQPGDAPLEIRNDFDQCTLTGRQMPMSYRAERPLIAWATSTDATLAKAGAGGFPVFLGPEPRHIAVQKFAVHRAGLRESGQSPEAIEHAIRMSLVTRHVIIAATDEEAWCRAEALFGRMPMLDRKNDTRTLRQMAGLDLRDVGRGDDIEHRNSHTVQSWLCCGSPESVTQQILAYPADGIEHLNIRFTVGLFNAALFGEMFDLFRSEVLPALDVQHFPDPVQRVLPPVPQLPTGA